MKMIYDCDPGTDDSLSLMLAALHPKVDLLAVTAESGNLSSDKTATNALRIMEYLGINNIPVSQGMLHPLIRTLPPDPYSHGEDGMGNNFLPDPSIQLSEKFPAQLIIDLVLANPNEITIVCTAPLTNIALAIMQKPEIKKSIKEIFHLGGAFGYSEFAFRNATGDNPMSEWNVFVDPEAAKIVYESGVNLTVIPLDIAFNPMFSNISPSTVKELEQINTKFSQYALNIINYIDDHNSIEEKGIFVNGPIDTIAMCSAINRQIIETKLIKVGVDTSDGISRGMTIWDRRDHFQWTHLKEIEVAFSLNQEQYQKTFLSAFAKGESTK